MIATNNASGLLGIRDHVHSRETSVQMSRTHGEGSSNKGQAFSLSLFLIVCQDRRKLRDFRSTSLLHCRDHRNSSFTRNQSINPSHPFSQSQHWGSEVHVLGTIVKINVGGRKQVEFIGQIHLNQRYQYDFRFLPQIRSDKLGCLLLGMRQIILQLRISTSVRLCSCAE